MNKTALKAPALVQVALSVLFAQGLFAQGLVSQKIAVIDMQSALIGTKDGQLAVTELRTRFTARSDALEKMQQDLQAKTDQYRRTQNTISETAKATLERDIAALTRNSEREGQDLKEETDQAEQKMVTDLGAQVMQVLTKYATDNHYTMVFDVSGQPPNILYASNTIDITREIVALYDKQSATAPPHAAAAPAARPAGIPSGAMAPRPAPLPGTPAAPKK
ncbi:MAG: OmpH family outer membrane protein [Terriglobia bacterium]